MSNKMVSGIVLLLVGLGIMFVSQSNALAEEVSFFGTGIFLSEEDSFLINTIFFVGLVLCIGGGVLTGMGINNMFGSKK